jgi:hypothetical protein
MTGYSKGPKKMLLEQTSTPKRFEFSAYVAMDGIQHARFITETGEPVLLTFEECLSRFGMAGSADVARAISKWPGQADHCSAAATPL